MAFPDLFRKRPCPRPSHAPRVQLRLEYLESRVVPYAATGNLWPQPALITLSFEPDGTNLGGRTSNLFAKFNAIGSTSAWQGAILKAAQTWAQQAGINFTVVNDSGAGSGSGLYQQGDPTFGDIRIGGFNFGNNRTLAMALKPPPVNNYSIAGDITFNTAQVYNINGLNYDLYTVALHELGHALGLDHSNTAAAVMYPTYQGVQYGLYTDDINGIQSIYGARHPDAYDKAASNGSFATASNITSTIVPVARTAVVPNLDITTTADMDYYKFTAPAGGTGTLSLTVRSQGLSLLAPSVNVYNATQTQLATATGSGSLGSTLTLNVSVTAGQSYYVRVAGANTTAFGTGKYGMALNFGSGPSPTLPRPNARTANGSPLSGGGGEAYSTGSYHRYDLLEVGDGGSEPSAASAGVTPPPQRAAAETTPAPRPAPAPGTQAVTVGLPAASATATRAALFGPSAGRPDAAGMLAQPDRPAAGWDSPGGAAPGTQVAGAGVAAVTPPLAAVSAWGAAGAPQDEGARDSDAAGPVSEQPAPPAAFDAPLGCLRGVTPPARRPAPATTAAAACDAYFAAAGWRATKGRAYITER
jgi:hypothetical protein